MHSLYTNILIEFAQLVRCIYYFFLLFVLRFFSRWTNRTQQEWMMHLFFICWFALNRMKFAFFSFFFLYFANNTNFFAPTIFHSWWESVGIFHYQNSTSKWDYENRKLYIKIHVIMILTMKFHIHWIQRIYMTESRRLKREIRRKEKNNKIFRTIYLNSWLFI